MCQASPTSDPIASVKLTPLERPFEEKEDEMDEGIRSLLSRREVPMVEPEVIVKIRGLGAVGWGARRPK